MILDSQTVIADSKGELGEPLDVALADDREAISTWVRLLQEEVTNIHRQFQVRNDALRVGTLSPEAHTAWRRRAGHAQHMLERRLRVAKALAVHQSDRGQKIVNVLAAAIRDHREACEAAGEPADFDHRLWSALHEVGFERAPS